jgi:hypothetical protein
MIDIDDVGDGFLYGGIVIGVIFLVCYFAFSRPVIDECEKAGGVVVKSNGKPLCVDKKALIESKKGK